MLRIALCDDAPLCVEQMRRYIELVGKRIQRKFEIVEVYAGDRLLDEIANTGSFDLILLDIEMPGMNGVDVAKKIREDDYQTLIVYVSSHEGYYRELFDVEPFRFVKKPVEEEIMISVITKAVERIDQKSTDFHFKSNRKILKIPTREIMYFDSQKRVVNVHTEKEVYSYYDKLDSISERMSVENPEFIRIHKSYLVNYHFIRQWEFTKVVLYNGTILQISEDRRKSVRENYMKLLGGYAAE